MGGRAYRARLQALTRAQEIENAPKQAIRPASHEREMSQSRPVSRASGIASSARLPVPSEDTAPAPQRSASGRLPAGFSAGPMAGGRYRDEEGGQEEEAVAGGSAYYGYDSEHLPLRPFLRPSADSFFLLANRV